MFLGRRTFQAEGDDASKACCSASGLFEPVGSVHTEPEMPEVCEDGLDNNRDGTVDEGVCT